MLTRLRRLPHGLYVVTPETDDDDWLTVAVAAAIRGGATTVQYRNKTIEPTHRLRQALRIRTTCRELGATFIINDSVELTRQSSADGVHLGRDDGDPREVRSELGADAIIGVSCYDSVERALQTREVTEYCAFGSVFPSRVKPAAVRARLELFGQARVAGLHPVAIGGIDAANAGAVARAGAAAVAVITAVFGEAGAEVKDPAEIENNARRIRRAFEAGEA